MFFVVLFFFCLFVSPVIAASGLIEVTPETISISTETGSISDTGMTIRNLDTITRPVSINFVRVKSPGDYKVLEPKYLTLPKNRDSIPPQESIDVPVSLNSEKLSSGEYRGTILVLSNTTEISVPVVLKVKASLLWPLVILGITEVVIIFAFDWAVKRKKRNILKINLIDLKQKVDSEELFKTNKFACFFKTKICDAIADADKKLSNDEFDNADKARDDAEKNWEKWNKYHDNWTIYLNKSKSLEERIEDLKVKFSKLEGKYLLFTEISDENQQFWTEAAAAGNETIIKFDRLIDLDSKITELENIVSEFQSVRDLCQTNNDPAIKSECSIEINELLIKLRATHLKDLKTENLNAVLTEIRKKLQRPGVMMGAGAKKFGIAEQKREIPDLLSIKLSSELLLLRKEISQIDFVKYTILPIVVFTIIGLGLLYFTNPVFGSIIDYTTLVFWGLMNCGANKDGSWEKILSLIPGKK
jgi:hypothetical protein